MTFEPDIVVRRDEPPGIGLVVEVKSVPRDTAAAEAQLKGYMKSNRCGLGMLVNPDRVLLYRDQFTGSGIDSVERIGAFPTTDLGLDASGPGAPGSSAQGRSLAFERQVQAWLVSLTDEAVTARLPPALRDAVSEYLLPLLRAGSVRAAGPRWRQDHRQP